MLRRGRGVSLSLSLSLLISTCFLHTESNERQIYSSSVCVCVRICVLAQAILCVSVGLLGTDTLDIQSQRFTKPPQPLQSWPWLILSFTFLSEIYYLLPWLVFYGLMTSNGSHHRGQLHPLCLCSSKCNFPARGIFMVLHSRAHYISCDCRGEIIPPKKDKSLDILNPLTFYPTAGLVYVALNL